MVIMALQLDKRMDAIIVGFFGRDGGTVNSCCNINLVVSSDVTARIQEIHMLIGHIICAVEDCDYYKLSLIVE